jgi:hypothetical protein
MLMPEHAIHTQLTVLGMSGCMSNVTNLNELDQAHKHALAAVLPLTNLTARPAPSLSSCLAAATPRKPAVLELGNIQDEQAYAIAAMVNRTHATACIKSPRDGFDFWAQRHVRRGEIVRLRSDGVCALQCAPPDALLIGTTLNMTALVDGRIQCNKINQHECAVRARGEIMRKQGLLVFRAKTVQASRAVGVVVLDSSVVLGENLVALKIQVGQDEDEWSLTVTLLE